MVDMHSHIINEIDDGSKSIEMTINMLKKCMYVAAHAGLAGKSAAKVLQIMRKKGEL